MKQLPNRIGEYSRKNNPKIYQTWQDMLTRCYDKKSKEKYPTYKNVTIDGHWANFQNFTQWFLANYNIETMKGWCLDKDILVKGNKIYSPETCCFVPKGINLLFGKNNAKRGNYPIGVCKFKNKFQATINIKGKTISLGHFDTPEEAFEAYKTAKEAYIKEVADEWKDRIEEDVYQAMYNWKVEIND